jgi:hypothetical protein
LRVTGDGILPFITVRQASSIHETEADR